MSEETGNKEPGTSTTWGSGLAIGVAVGVAIGVAMGNVVSGIGVGLAIGIALGLAFQASSASKDERTDGSGETGDPGADTR